MEGDGLLQRLQPGLCPRRRVHAPHVDRRPRGQCRLGAAAGPAMPRRRCRAGRFPGVDVVRLLHRGHPAAGRAAGRRRGRRWPTSSPLPPTCCRCWWSARRCATGTASTTPPWSSTAARVLGVAPKSYLPTYREFYERRQIAPGRRRARHHPDRRHARRRSARTCCSRPPTCPASCCTSRSARTCSCRFRPAPRRRWPVRRCWPTCPAARSRSAAPRTARCWPARRRRAAWPPTCMPLPEKASRPPTWHGTARP